jgi:hypothetical protein
METHATASTAQSAMTLLPMLSDFASPEEFSRISSICSSLT